MIRLLPYLTYLILSLLDNAELVNMLCNSNSGGGREGGVVGAAVVILSGETTTSSAALGAH